MNHWRQQPLYQGDTQPAWYENRYMGSAEFAGYLQPRRAEIQDFLTYIGIKP